ncbi:MAG: exonuclease SbcCD subunit D [Anaerolineales bacterium]|nr:exonuclease SbcCD subunit D [Anaerolineales bacterium]
MAPIHVLHFADLHIGMENYGKFDPQTGLSTRLRDFLDRLDEIVAYAQAHAADLIVFAGDAFKTRDPDPTQQREFARRLKQLADRAPVFLLVGNHDIPGMAARATSIDIFRALDVPNVTVGRSPGSRVIATAHGPVFLGWVPFPVRNRLLNQEEHRGASVETLDRAVEQHVTTFLSDLAQEAAQHAMPRLLVGHFSVGGATFGSERSVMLGRDLVVQKSALADPAWDYVALGHIHKHQNLTPARPRGAPADFPAGGRLPPIVYSGSLERIDFGEEHEAKGFCWVTLERNATDWQFVPVNARPFRSVSVDARAVADPTTLVLNALAERRLAGAVVRLQIQLGDGQEAALRRKEIEAALAATAGPATLIVQVETATRQVGVGLNAEALTPLQWVERYCAVRQKPPERTARLLAAAADLLQGTGA